MTRPIELKDPDDPRQIMAYIERNARRSTSAILNKLLKSMPTPLRDVNLRPSERAFIADSPCNNCQAQAGPFKDCVILVGYDDFTKKCCTNCQWQLYTAKTRVKGKLCTHALDRAHNSRVVKSRQQICPLNAFIHGADTALEYQEATASDSRISAEGTLEGDVCILGDLVLPPLTTASSEIQEIVKDLLPHLEMLQNRDMTTIQKPISDIDRAFEEFKKLETESWKASGLQIPPPPEFLVKPSGSFQSPISHRANQPSFTTNISQKMEKLQIGQMDAFL